MILDYVDGYYILHGPRTEIDPNAIMLDHGFDLSLSRSDERNVLLFTREPYAAVSFIACGGEQARKSLAHLEREIIASRAMDGPHIACPTDEELSGYQKGSIVYALERQNALIGDEPGLGKTAEAICFANEIKAKRILVLCPAAIRNQWVREIQRWTLMKWPYSLHLVQSGRSGVNPNANWTICSYDMARIEGIGKQLAARHYDCGIFDEIHYLKTTDSKRTRAVFGGGDNPPFQAIAEKCQRILGLSGTPLPNRPRELYTITRGLCFDAIDWLSEDRFFDRFNPSIRVQRFDPKLNRTIVYNDERTGRHMELQNRLRANFMTRHLKREVLPQLKLPVYDIIRAETTGPVKSALAAEKLLDLDPDTLSGNPSTFGGAVATVRREMGEALAPQVITYAQLLLTGGVEKLVIFAWHKSVLDILEKGLHKWGVLRIDGSTTLTMRSQIVKSFQQDAQNHVIIGNLLSLGTGTDGLQNICSNVLIAEPSWVPGENIQAIDRLDRIGQKRTVMADIFVAPGSFSEHILSTALRKGQTIHKTLDQIGV